MNRALRLCLFLLSYLILASSCTLQPPPPPQEAAAAVQGETLTAAFGSLPTSLAPHAARGWHKNQVLALVYEGLTRLDQRLQPAPSLATDWDVSADGLVYTVRLRRGVQFHHGKELEAADVRYSFQQAASSQAAQQDEGVPFSLIAAIHTPDVHTVRFVLKEPYAPFLTKLTVIYCPIVPHVTATTTSSVPPGTGPFQVSHFQSGHVIVLKKFTGYWEDGLPRLDSVVLRQVEYAATRLQLLQRSEVDFILLDPLFQQTTPPAYESHVVQTVSAPTGTFSVILHTRRQPFVQADVRRALVWAIDKAALTQEVLGEYGVAVNQPFAPESSLWHFSVAEPRSDMMQAKALLAKAGYAEGIGVNLPVIAEAALFINIALALQKQAQAAGIRIQVEVLPEESVRERIRQGTWDLLLRGEESQPDPDDVYFRTLHSSGIGSSNLSGYASPALDALLSTGRRTFDLGARRAIYRQVVTQMQEAVPELYLFMARWPVAWRPQVQGYNRELLHCCLMHTLTEIANQGFKTMWLTK